MQFRGTTSGAVTSPRLGTSRIVMAMVIAFIAALLVGATPGLAHAGTANSSVGVFTTAGVGYQNYASIQTTTGAATALTYTGPRSSTVAAGWVGSRGRLFNSVGGMICEGSNDFSNQSLGPGSYWNGSSCYYTATGGTWHSYGVSLTWTGSGYASTYTLTSPNQNS